MEVVVFCDELLMELEEFVVSVFVEELMFIVQNNVDFVVLFIGFQDGLIVEVFVQKYVGQLIEFDGVIGVMNFYEGYMICYDIMIVSGDYSEIYLNGGFSFQFCDVNIMNDLYFMDDVFDMIGVGDNVYVIVCVGLFDGQLFFFELVQISVC